MGAQNISTKNLSFSRGVTSKWRQFYAHRLQWFRSVLGFAAGFHLIPNFGKLFGHYSTHPPSVLPDSLAFSLSIAARFTWLFLFRDPASFLQFKRSGRAYRWMVYGTVALTTLPNGLVHFWALEAALKSNTYLATGVVQAILAIASFIPLAGLVWWMAWRFLLGVSESDEEFEPTAKNNWTTFGRHSQHLVSAIEPYMDDVFVSATGIMVANGYLSQAYRKKRLATQDPCSNRASVRNVETFSQPEAVTDEEEQEQPGNDASNATLTTDVAHPLRCQTIARFDYMSQSHSGPHSWFSFPLIPLILSTYATILLVGLPIWIHEDRKYKLRAPSR
jgi:hypothetical protein